MIDVMMDLAREVLRELSGIRMALNRCARAFEDHYRAESDGGPGWWTCEQCDCSTNVVRGGASTCKVCGSPRSDA